MLSKESLNKFKTIYMKRFGKELSDADTLEKATQLFSLVKLVYKPMTKEDFARVQARRKELQQK